MRHYKDKLQPPQWADRFLRWRLPEEQFEELQGDMHELYGQWVEEVGERKARWRYLLNAFTFLRPLPTRSTTLYEKNNLIYSLVNPFLMISSYLKIAYRNLLRHKSFSFINILGLSLGLTACLLIALFVRDERSFDTFIPHGERIYRVYYQVSNTEGSSHIATVPPMFTTTLQQNFSQVEHTLRVLNIQGKELFEAGNKKIYEEGGIYADSSFFDIFPLSFIHGSTQKALDDPTSIILSEQMAEKYFGKENPVGKSIKVDKTTFQVQGIFEANPKFHLSLQYILPMAASGLTQEQLESWSTYSYFSYVKLQNGTDVEALEAQFQAYVLPHIKDELSTYQPVFQPLHNIHLYSSTFKYDIAQRGNITYVKALTIIALFILLIACFNFVNLATAKSLQRAKEVGVRKTIGASRKQLMVQYITETVLLSFISVVLATACTYLFLPSLNRFAEKQIIFDLFTNPVIMPFLLLVTLAVGVLAGFYPALVLSGFQPVRVLKGTLASESKPGKTPWLRHGLVVVQFSLSVMLIISAIVVIRQVNFLHNKDLGFNKEQIMFFPMRGDNMFKSYETFKNELLQSPNVSSVSIGYGFPGDMFGDGLMTAPMEGVDKKMKATQMMVDPDYIPTLGLQLVAGRNFSKEMKTDQDAAYIINETAANELGFSTPDQALGQTLLWNTWRKPDFVKKGQVVGVVKDFHFKSLYDKMEPAVLQVYPEAYWKVAVKMKTADISNTLAYVQKVWSKFTPDYPIEYRFLDESFDQMYKAEDKLKSLLWIFTAITVFVACLGLFGLAAYGAERRKKEIGIRKVLGASVEGIVLLLSKEFVKLVVVALLIASPMAWYAMSKWLEDFAYRIELEWWIFAIAGIVAIVIALLTVSFQSVKAALINPVKYLRSE
jgi:putative ABC transport system permease protein